MLHKALTLYQLTHNIDRHGDSTKIVFWISLCWPDQDLSTLWPVENSWLGSCEQLQTGRKWLCVWGGWPGYGCFICCDQCWRLGSPVEVIWTGRGRVASSLKLFFCNLTEMPIDWGSFSSRKFVCVATKCLATGAFGFCSHVLNNSGVKFN